MVAWYECRYGLGVLCAIKMMIHRLVGFVFKMMCSSFMFYAELLTVVNRPKYDLKVDCRCRSWSPIRNHAYDRDIINVVGRLVMVND